VHSDTRPLPLLLVSFQRSALFSNIASLSSSHRARQFHTHSVQLEMNISNLLEMVSRLVPLPVQPRRITKSLEEIMQWRSIIFNVLHNYYVIMELGTASGLVVRVLGYRSGGPGSIPGTTRKKSNGSGTGSIQLREYNWGATWKKSSGSCLGNREYGRKDPSRWPRGTLYPQELAITSPTSGGLSVGIVLSRTQTMEFFF
jgi:hypothetical protein